MNRTKLKNYAPQARRDFIQAMTDRAAFYGFTATKIEPITEKGDVAIIAGRSHPRAIVAKRKALEARIELHGFVQTMEALAYTWFNRFVAIRYMELHGYLDHGYRVLSHPEDKDTPEIVEHAEHVELPGLKKEEVIDLKIAGNKEPELYRRLLTAQCNALHQAMPFLFEKIDDETELLLPDNLLNSDSLLRRLVNEIDKADWQEVEIIGWLYQFYISDKKAEVIGKVVASEDIPAATQLFTPNWIVKYLVQNTLGRQWLATYPQSVLRQQMEYYIEPAEQTPEVQEQLKAITPTSLNPEELTLLDPACGSGHILVEAYDLFKAIYQERGYQAKVIPALILNKNLFGLEIDDRAAQLAAFALMMKARADDRRFFDGEAKLNILAFQDSKGMNAADITRALNSPINKEAMPRELLFEEIEDEKAGLFSNKVLAEKGHVSQSDITALLELFENAKTFGSLILVPPKLAAKLPEIKKRCNDVLNHGDLSHASAHVVKPLLQQAQFLGRQYDAVVANPPYMGSKGMNAVLKAFANSNYSESKSDLFAVFAERLLELVKPDGFAGLMTPFTWMFISSYEHLRRRIIENNTLLSLIQPEYHAFFDSAFVPICSFVVQTSTIQRKSDFIRLTQFYGEDVQSVKTLEAIHNPTCGWRYTVHTGDFGKIPGCPIAYWASESVRSMFGGPGDNIGDRIDSEGKNVTGNNEKYIRYFWEVSFSDVGGVGKRWFPIAMGGDYRKWAGNIQNVVDWSDNAKTSYRTTTTGRIIREEFWYRTGITWGKVTSSVPSFRLLPKDATYQETAIMPKQETDIMFLLGLLNSCVIRHVLSMINPTINLQLRDIKLLCMPQGTSRTVASDIVKELVVISEDDWNASETAIGFSLNKQLENNSVRLTIEDSHDKWNQERLTVIRRAKSLEEKINHLFIDLFRLQHELLPDVADDQITLSRPDRHEDTKRLLSYAIGCIMGRYSLDKPGLIYAHSGNQGFDHSQYKTIPADDDGIIPLHKTDWGIRDDATTRIEEFIGFAWPKEHLEENLMFVAESLGPTNSEQPRDTIRRYFATEFYKDHLRWYKRRPIYWLFSSGKQRAFQCLVYLHRYNPGTLARMRTEYVIPLQGQIAARIEQLEGDKAKATSTSHRKKLQKEQDELRKQQVELVAFDEKLKHAADQKIALDLDDGVKTNYAKFADLLAEVKAITGGKDEE